MGKTIPPVHAGYGAMRSRQAEDSGSCVYANNQWHTNSTVTGHPDAGTCRVIDARDVEFSGSQASSVWKRR
jgi:hypothetical protein